MSVFSTPHFTVIDARTTTEEAHFSYPMPTVTGAVKRLTEGESCKGAARLLPIIAKSHGKNTVSLLDILFLGGGALIDNFKSIDKVMEQLAGKDFADGTAKGLDAHLHSSYAKWRQLLMVLHRSATGVEKEALEEESDSAPVAAWPLSDWFAAPCTECSIAQTMSGVSNCAPSANGKLSFFAASKCSPYPAATLTRRKCTGFTSLSPPSMWNTCFAEADGLGARPLQTSIARRASIASRYSLGTLDLGRKSRAGASARRASKASAIRRGRPALLPRLAILSHM